MKVNNIIDNMKTGKRLFVLLGMVGLLLVFIVIKFNDYSMLYLN